MVCVGNVCRSPVAERVLREMLPAAVVTSAGIGALVGHGADSTAGQVAAQHGVSLANHSARQFSSEIAVDADLILVMEPAHRQSIAASHPHVSGKTMLFDQWTGAKGIPDPYRRSLEFHQNVFDMIEVGAEAWAQKLGSEG